MNIKQAKEIMNSWIKYEKQNKNKINKADELIDVQETLMNYIKDLEERSDKHA